MKAIGIKMVELQPMTAREANQYAMEEVVNDPWAHLGFVLQWAKYGLNAKSKEEENNEIAE